ncbi:MAG: DUF488 family protein [Thauera sp.]
MPLVLTIGHSTHPIENFIDLLKVHDAGWVVEVRTAPRSRHNPQFNRESWRSRSRMRASGTCTRPGLDGLRRARPRFVQQRMVQCLVSRRCGLHSDARSLTAIGP